MNHNYSLFFDEIIASWGIDVNEVILAQVQQRDDSLCGTILTSKKSSFSRLQKKI